MRYYSLLVLLIIGLTNLSAQVLPIGDGDNTVDPSRSWEAGQRWEEIRDLDGGFRVLVPSAFDHRVDSVATPIGDLAYHTFWVAARADSSENDVYMLSYVDYPEGSLHHDSTDLVKMFLDASEEEAKGKLRGEILFSTDRSNNGFPGRFWRIDYLNGNASVRTQAFVAGNRYYSLQTVSRTERGVNKSTDKYFESFFIFDR